MIPEATKIVRRNKEQAEFDNGTIYYFSEGEEFLPDEELIIKVNLEINEYYMTTYFFQVDEFSLVNRQGYEFIEPYVETFIIEATTDDEAFAEFKEKFRKEHFRPDETKNFVVRVFYYLTTRPSLKILYSKEYTLEEVFGDRIIK